MSVAAVFRDRIKELRRVKAGELRSNIKNWRLHPEGQRSALAGVLAEVGFVGAVIAREVEGGLELLDGHLRADLAAGSEVPVLIVDVNDDEAAKILATYDPLSSMSLIDGKALSALLADVEFDDNADLRRLLSDLHEQVIEDHAAAGETPREVEGMALQPHEHYDYLVVLSTTPQEWNVLCDRLGLVPEKRRRRMGTCRAIRASKLLPLLGA
jgi:ParB-like chromosome segregation protein Spo0J